MTLERPASKSSDSNSKDGVSCEKINVRIPKRILHFSDGILEEYSDDEDTTPPKKDSTALVDATTLAWGPWLLHQALGTGKLALFVCDYIGETLANIFGITTPKYQYELEEFERMEAEKRKSDEISKGWTTPSDTELGKFTKDQPQAGPPISV